MSKTLVDIDDELLAKAQELLGTKTKKDTVNAALRAAIQRASARELIDLYGRGVLDDLSNPDVMARAWRRA